MLLLRKGCVVGWEAEKSHRYGAPDDKPKPALRLSLCLCLSISLKIYNLPLQLNSFTHLVHIHDDLQPV